MIDLLRDWLPGPKGGYLTGTHDLVTRIYPTRLVWIKSAKKGFPTDVWGIKIVNGKKILTFFQTENGDVQGVNNGWNNPKSYKLNTDELPPFVDLYPSRVPDGFAPQDVTHEDYIDGVRQTPLWKALSDANCEIEQPIVMDHGGDVKVQPTLLIHWQYGKFINQLNPVREVYYICKGWGQVGWAELHLDADGLYTIIKSRSFFNTFVKCDPLPDPVFGFPTSWLP